MCRYYLFGVCKFGERCSYLHSKEHLLQRGWWSTTDGIEKEKKRYELLQMCNKALADYNSQTKAAGTSQALKKKQPKGKKKRNHRSRVGSGIPGTNPSEVGQSSQRIGARNKKPTIYSYSKWPLYESDGDDENGMCGFTGSEVDELLCQGVKPWDDDAWVRLTALSIDPVRLRFPLQGCHGCPAGVLTSEPVTSTTPLHKFICLEQSHDFLFCLYDSNDAYLPALSAR